MPDKLPGTKQTREVIAIADKIKPLLAGRTPEIQGAVLAELLSIFLAGHAPELRPVILRHHLDAVRELTEVNAHLLRGEK